MGINERPELELRTGYALGFQDYNWANVFHIRLAVFYLRPFEEKPDSLPSYAL